MTQAARASRTSAALLAITAFLLAGLLVAWLNESTYRVRRGQNLQAQAEVLALTVAPALVFDDADAARETVAALRADREIEAAAVIGSTGVTQAAFLRSGPPVPRPLRLGPVETTGGRFVATAPVRFENAQIGAVYLRTGAQPWQAGLSRHGGVLLLAVLAAVAAGLFGGVQRELSRANQRAQARAEELAVSYTELREQVSRREEAEAALRQAQKMEAVGQLTGGIAHDFNNLLQGVSGSLDLIRRKPTDSERVKLWAERGFEAAERGAKLTAQLLAFSRAQKLELKATSPSQVVETVADLLGSTMGPGVELRLELEAGDAPVMTDPTQLELAVLNLAINARDAMPNGGVLTVCTHRAHLSGDLELPDGEYVTLSVADTGVGMPEDVIGRAFDPFFTTKGVGRGTGLGLAQVYSIARQAGGVARIRSPPGEGATVTLFLPLAGGESAPARSVAAELAGFSLVGRTIVVADDDAGARAYIVDALQGLGAQVRAARDGAEALPLVEASTDLLIVDFAMPGLSGAEVADQARRQYPTLPVIIASGYADSAAIERVFGGSAHLLRKPFDLNQLAATAGRALEGRPQG
jgi:signal transduction histidine kinase